MWRKIKNFYHLFAAVLANVLFLFPSKGMTVIGVTGTDGKTTTTALIYHILQSSGHKVSMISSTGAVIEEKNYDLGFHVTTPSPFLLQKFLRKAKSENSEYFVLEVTSHAIDQNRIAGINFEVGVLTNITNEHLDYHKTYENYLKTKIKLLEKSKLCIVNSDDSSYPLLSGVKKQKPESRWITYGLSKASDVNPDIFDLKESNLIGEFNRYNLLAAVAVCRVLGIDKNIIKEAVKTFRAPKGREEFVYNDGFSVMVDFAHTPNSFEQILKALRPKVTGRIIHVFGSAGERDASKRPVMGKISSEYSDVLILTAEDPRKEDINKIIEEIESGIKKGDCEVFRIPDRKEAIAAAVQMAKKDDLVLITGKAHESSMNYGRGEEPWDEFSVVEEALDIRNKDEE